MNKLLKNQIKTAFFPPPAEKKAGFLKDLPYPKSSLKNFLAMQLRYIRKRVWLTYGFVLLSGLVAGFLWPSLGWIANETQFVWVISALLPVVTLSTIGELYRADFFQMAELEMSCKYNLSQIIMAKLTIFGLCNVVILPILIGLCYYRSSFGLLQVVLYLIVPYLLSCVGSMMILRRWRSKEGIYSCAVLTFFIGVFPFIVKKVAYEPEQVPMWIGACLLCLGCMAVQVKNNIKEHQEAVQWNL